MLKYDVNIRGDVFGADPIDALNKIIDYATKVKNSEAINDLAPGESINVDLNFSLYEDE